MIRRGQDELYDETWPPDSKTRTRIESLRAPDLFRSQQDSQWEGLPPGPFDPKQRQHDISGSRIVGEKPADEPIGSTILKRYDDLLRSASITAALPSEPDSTLKLPVSYLSALEESLRLVPYPADEVTVASAVSAIQLEGVFPALAALDEPSLQGLYSIATKLGMLTLRRKYEDELKRAAGTTLSTPTSRKDTAVGTPRREVAASTPRRETPTATPRKEMAVATPRREGALATPGSTPRKAVPSASRAGAGRPGGKALADDGAGTAGTTSAAGGGVPDGTPQMMASEAASQLGSDTAATLRGNLDATASRRGRTAAMLWGRIVARTDELLIVAESMQPVYEQLLRALVAAEELPADALQMGPIKDPVRVHEKAVDDYTNRFGEAAAGLPEASVADVIRARIICMSGTQLLQVADRLVQGFTHEGATLTLVRLENKFTHLNPSHFRYLICNVVVDKLRKDVTDTKNPDT